MELWVAFGCVCCTDASARGIPPVGPLQVSGGKELLALNGLPQLVRPASSVFRPLGPETSSLALAGLPPRRAPF